jgi:uncharacterized membrane protein HdeD (DUF308 family)
MAEVVKTVSSSPGLNAGLARNWWAVGLRGILAVAFGLAVLALPPPTLASLIVWFAAYLAADGIFALLAATWAARRGERSLRLIYEGATNLAVAAGVLAWHVITIVPFFRLASVWAVVTGALLLAAARRLSLSHGRRLLAVAGILSVAWGALVAAWGPSSESVPATAGWWLVGYALPFAAILTALAGLLQRRHRQSHKSAERNVVTAYTA